MAKKIAKSMNMLVFVWGSGGAVDERLHAMSSGLTTASPSGISAAHIAAYYGHWHVLEFLAKECTQHLFAEADDGGTPAHHAAAAGRTGLHSAPPLAWRLGIS